jgi:hypothetical protein
MGHLYEAGPSGIDETGLECFGPVLAEWSEFGCVDEFSRNTSDI